MNVMKKLAEALIGLLMFCGMLIGGVYLLAWLLSWGDIEVAYDHVYVPTEDNPIPFSGLSFDRRVRETEMKHDPEQMVRRIDTWREIERTISSSEKSMKSTAIEVGSQAVILTDWTWVNEVERDFSIKQWFGNEDQRRYVYTGESCGIQSGMIIAVEEIRGDSLFVKLLEGYNIGQGTPCRSGVRFIAKKSDLIPLDDFYSTERGFTQPEEELVTQLLDKGYYGETMDVGDWYWVEPVNYHKCGIGPYHYGDRYFVEGGTVQVRGEASGRVLYEYTARGNPMRTACSSGILFFGER